VACPLCTRERRARMSVRVDRRRRRHSGSRRPFSCLQIPSTASSNQNSDTAHNLNVRGEASPSTLDLRLRSSWPSKCRHVAGRSLGAWVQGLRPTRTATHTVAISTLGMPAKSEPCERWRREFDPSCGTIFPNDYRAFLHMASELFVPGRPSARHTARVRCGVLQVRLGEPCLFPFASCIHSHRWLPLG
jgi:hypothetical protein